MVLCFIAWQIRSVVTMGLTAQNSDRHRRCGMPNCEFNEWGFKMKREEFVAHYLIACVGLTTTENAIKMAEAAWLVYKAWTTKK